MWCGYQKLGNYFHLTFRCICGFFTDTVVLCSYRQNIRSMAVIVRKFADLLVTERIGRWQLVHILPSKKE